MSLQILLRRGTAAQWTATNPTLALGEFGYETDTKKLKVGDGVTVWTSLSYVASVDSYIPSSIITAKGQIITGSSVADYAVLPIGTAGQVVVEDVTAGTLAYQSLSLSGLPDVDVAGATTNDLFSRGASTWGRTTFSAAFAGNTLLTDIIKNGDSRVGVAGYFSQCYASLITVYKWAFPADTVSTTTSSPNGMSKHAGFANPAVAGYFSQGDSSRAVYKWAFPADTVTTTTSAPASMRLHAGFANPSVAGYFSRGNLNTAVYKWTFPADTVTTTTAAPASMIAHAGFANPAVAGYLSAGNSTNPVYKWAFPADTASTTTSAPAGMRFHAGFANPSVAGYFSRGDFSTAVYKWAFPADTVSTTTSAPGTLYSDAGFANPAVAGYFSQGGFSATVYKWAFPTDTVSTTTSAPNGMSNHAGFANA